MSQGDVETAYVDRSRVGRIDRRGPAGERVEISDGRPRARNVPG